MLAWPSISWIARRSAPPESRWVAKECLSKWGFTTFEIPARAACFLTMDQSATRESAGWGRELVGLILIDISFPIDGEAAGVEYAHTASGWLGRRFDIIEDGTVVAVFDGPVAPVVERIVLARPCTMPHTAAA